MSVPPREDEQSIKDRGSQLYRAERGAEPEPVPLEARRRKPFAAYLAETPAMQMSRATRAALTAAGLVVLGLFALSVAAVLINRAEGEAAADRPAIDFADGFTSLADLTSNGFGPAPVLSGTALRLTDGGGNEARSVFYNTPVAASAFRTTFRFRIAPGAEIADGFTFCLQGTGPTALGGGGGGLGCAPGPGNPGAIGKSVAVRFDLYKEKSNTTALMATGGADPDQSAPVGMAADGIDLHDGATYRATLRYDGRTLSLKVADEANAGRAFARDFAVDIPAAVGGETAFVGFTGGTGGLAATQDILSWTYTPRHSSRRESPGAGPVPRGESAGLIHRYTFDEGAGTTAADSAGSAHGQLEGGAGWAPGKVGAGALRLGGSGQFVTVPGSALDTAGSYTVCAWVSWDGGPSFRTALSRDGDRSTPFFLQKRADGPFRLNLTAADSNEPAQAEAPAAAAPTAQRWYFLAASRDAATGKGRLYVDGVLQGETPPCPAWKAGGPLVIGAARWNGNRTDFWDGLIDDVRIYDRALGADEVAALMGVAR